MTCSHLGPGDITAGGADAKREARLHLARKNIAQEQNLLHIAGITPGEHTGNVAIVVGQGTTDARLNLVIMSVELIV